MRGFTPHVISGGFWYSSFWRLRCSSRVCSFGNADDHPQTSPTHRLPRNWLGHPDWVYWVGAASILRYKSAANGALAVRLNYHPSAGADFWVVGASLGALICDPGSGVNGISQQSNVDKLFPQVSDIDPDASILLSLTRHGILALVNADCWINFIQLLRHWSQKWLR